MVRPEPKVGISDKKAREAMSDQKSQWHVLRFLPSEGEPTLSSFSSFESMQNYVKGVMQSEPVVYLYVIYGGCLPITGKPNPHFLLADGKKIPVMDATTISAVPPNGKFVEPVGIGDVMDPGLYAPLIEEDPEYPIDQ